VSLKRRNKQKKNKKKFVTPWGMQNLILLHKAVGGVVFFWGVNQRKVDNQFFNT
jgi:hypothetical protein